MEMRVLLFQRHRAIEIRVYSHTGEFKATLAGTGLGGNYSKLRGIWG